MRISLVAHGFPPELRGGTENSTQALARELAARGHEVSVIAGSMQWQDGLRRSEASDRDPATGAELRVLRIHRSDAYFDHWQKAEHPGAGRLFDELLDELAPEVLHVQHWNRLSNDLVVRAARRGISAVVTLNDLWSSCLVAFRVRPDLRRFCEASLAPEPCLACAGHLPPRPVWQTAEEGAALVAAFRSAARRELELARAVISPSRVHGLASARWLELDAGGFAERLHVIAPARTPRPRASAPPVVPAAFTEDQPLVLGSFGHLTELKGTDLLIEALGLVAEPRRFRLLLAGTAPEPAFGQRIEALAAAAPAPVELLGDYDSSQLASHPVARAHLWVSASRAHESFGLVVDEALELGCGLLLPDLGALGERAHAVRWAEAYPSGDARALATRLDELVADPGRVAGLARAARAALDTGDATARTLSLDEHVERSLALYRAARDEGPPEAPPADPHAEAQRLLAIDAWDQALASCDPVELGLA